MPGQFPSFDPESLRKLRRLVQRLARTRRRSVPLRELVELGAAELPGDLTIDLHATRVLGAPLLVHGARPAECLRRLGKREREIAALIAEGLSNKQIAGRTGLTLGTVKDYVHRVLIKTGLPNRAAIVAALAGYRPSRPQSENKHPRS